MITKLHVNAFIPIDLSLFVITYHCIATYELGFHVLYLWRYQQKYESEAHHPEIITIGNGYIVLDSGTISSAIRRS